MRTIDMASWSRREQFEMFHRSHLPYFNVCADVNVTGTRPEESRSPRRLCICSHILRIRSPSSGSGFAMKKSWSTPWCILRRP